MAQRGMLFLESARGDPYFCSHFRAVAQFKPISRFLTDMQHASRSPMSSPSLLSVLGNHEISSISHVTMSPSRQNNLVSMFSSMPSSKSSYSLISAFCTEDNIPHCISYINQVWTVFWVYPLKYLLYFLSVIASLIDFFFFFLLTNLCKKSVIRHLRSTQLWSVSASPTQELSSLGFSPCIEANLPGRGDLNTVAALNAMYELLQIHRRNMNTLEELEKEHLRKTSLLEHMQMNNSRLKVCIAGHAYQCTQNHSCKTQI